MLLRHEYFVIESRCFILCILICAYLLFSLNFIFLDSATQKRFLSFLIFRKLFWYFQNSLVKNTKATTFSKKMLKP